MVFGTSQDGFPQRSIAHTVRAMSRRYRLAAYRAFSAGKGPTGSQSPIANRQSPIAIAIASTVYVAVAVAVA
jgi:hypothetical protein